MVPDTAMETGLVVPEGMTGSEVFLFGTESRRVISRKASGEILGLQHAALDIAVLLSDKLPTAAAIGPEYQT